MKKITITCMMTALLLGLPGVARAQEGRTELFYEDFGTAASKKDEPIEDHVWNTNDKQMFSWTAGEESSINVRTNNDSEKAYMGASGDGNLYFKGEASLTITGIPTAHYSDLRLYFGIFSKNSADVNTELLGTPSKADGNYMTVSRSLNGGEFKEFYDFYDLGLSQKGDVWDYVDGMLVADSAETVSLTFTSHLNPAADGGIRLDDIRLKGRSVTTGLTETLVPDVIAVSGRTIRYQGRQGRAEVYSLGGVRVGEVPAGSSLTLQGVPAGVYVVATPTSRTKVSLQ